MVVFFCFLLVGCTTELVKECESDSDCVPERCCHPKSCISRDQAPDCSDIYCTLDYQEDDITQSDCKCIEGMCN